jgi:phage FluMu gp28-like protein
LRGNEATHIVVDEAAYVPEEVITEVAMPMLATTDGSLTLISTPCGRNHFYRFFEMGTRGENGFWSRTAPSSESPFVRPGFLEVQRELISERAYLTEYEAQFMDSAGRVFRTEDIEKCLVPKLPRDPEPKFFIGVDWARYNDFTTVAVICGTRQDAMLVETDRFNRMNWARQIERIAKLVLQYPEAHVVCDATGGGDLATEALQQRLPHASVKEYVFSSTSKPPLVNGLEWIIEHGNLKMTPNPILQKELEHYESSTNAYGHTKFESRSGFHDDMVIALALAVHQLPTDYRPKIAVGKERTFDFATENENHEP